MLLKPSAGKLVRVVKRRLAPGRAGLRGYIEGADTRELFGWAHDPAHPGPLRLGLFTDRGLVATTTSGRSRDDVRAAGFGDGNAGFGFTLDRDVLGSIAASGGEVQLRVLNGAEAHIDSFTFSKDLLARYGLTPGRTKRPPRLDDPILEKCRSRLFLDLDVLLNGLEAKEVAAYEFSADHPLHQALFAPVSAKAGNPVEAAEMPPELPGYLDFTRYRYRVDREFDTDALPEERAHFLSWYLEAYGAVRQGRRIPLSSEVITYLNAPIIIGGKRHSMTRAMWWALARQPQRQAALQAGGAEWFLEAFYWWANEGAPTLGVEDCLVPDFMAEALCAVAENDQDIAWPLSPFIHRLYRDTPSLHFLNGEFQRERALLILSLMLMALRRPDLVRFIPGQSLRAAFAKPSNGGPAPFQAFLQSMLPEVRDLTLSYQRYAALLRGKGFDLETRRFLTIDSKGNRYHATVLPKVRGEALVDVQMIGPFEKASGLGQATRLSASAMEHAGVTFNKVDFGLDNPAPEGFSTATEHGAYRPARINLIHLNAESVPNVLAYEPDVFNGAYNIGYFFWELDSPAACHSLSLGLLDEIWVSSQYGVDIYQPHTDIPVTRIGMCFEDLEQPSRAQARAFILEHFGLKPDAFVFLVAFDSFSFVQRKNPVGVLQAFRAAFQGVPDVRLIIKTQNRDKVGDPEQQRIWRQVEELIQQDARILLMNETLSYTDLIRLKKGADCYISLHRSEGWGFGMIEAMNLKVPVVCTGYSGNMEFCTTETAWLVDYELIALKPNDYIFVREGQRWADPSIKDAARQMRAVYDNPEARARKATAAQAFVQKHFTAQAIGARYGARLEEILGQLKSGKPVRK